MRIPADFDPRVSWYRMTTEDLVAEQCRLSEERARVQAGRRLIDLSTEQWVEYWALTGAIDGIGGVVRERIRY